MIGQFAKFIIKIDKQLKNSCDCYEYINNESNNFNGTLDDIKNSKNLFNLKKIMSWKKK